MSGGQNIAAVRQQTGTNINITKGGPGIQDRVVTITGALEFVQKAVQMIATQIEHESAQK